LKLLVNLIKKRDIDIVNAHFAIPSAFPGILAKKLTETPSVVTVIGGDIYDPSKTKNLFRRFFLNPSCRYVLKNADSLTSISQDIKNRAMALVERKDITVIPYGVNTDLFNPNKRKNSKRKEFDWKNSKIILSVGRLIKRKGYEYLLNAIPKVLRDFPESLFVIVGDGPERTHLTQLINKLEINDNVLFLGNVSNENLPEIYANSDLFILPSLHEGLGIVYLEAMASGLPIITTNSGGMRDLINSGQTGMLIEPKNSDRIAESINVLLSDEKLARYLANNGRTLVERKYSWSQTAIKYMRVYESV
ncbi:MAG: glycosyltransferase family 4 protein, partial [Promethearchaeota archaeon]